MKRRWGAFVRKGVGVVALSAVMVGAGPAAPAHASLLGGLVGTVTGVVGGVVGIVLPGWDDGATTAPTPIADVTKAVGAQAMWSRGYDGTGVGVALIDSGVAPVEGLTVPGKIVNGPDLSFESQSDTYRYLDSFGHGTHMAGIIGGKDSSGTAFKGVAPGARIVNMRVADRQGAVDVSQVIASIDWVVAHHNDPGLNIKVISLSYGTDGVQDRRLDPLSTAVEAAWKNGITVVVAGGNDGTDRASLVDPAVNPFVLAVGALDLAGTTSATDDKAAPFSSRGSSSRWVDVAAPGVSIARLRDPGSTIDDAHPTAVVNDRFFRGSGTSQATAVTAGAVALLLQARPELTPDGVKSLLRTTATPVASSEVTRAVGSGRINVDLASRTTLPLSFQQGFTASTGTGTLEGARGTEHLSTDGIELRGEVDVMGQPWNGATWAPKAFAGTAWNAGWWNGTEWTGTCLCSDAWSGKSWTGKSWTGKSWTGKSWTSIDWTGKSWTGKSWTGDSWTGKSWTGKSWTGKSWTSSSSGSVA
jgi:serine protease AprX